MVLGWSPVAVTSYSIGYNDNEKDIGLHKTSPKMLGFPKKIDETKYVQLKIIIYLY